MNKEDCFQLGLVTKKHGFNGAVSIFLDTDRPGHYSNLESAFIVINDKPVPFFFNEFHILRNDTARVVIEGITTADQAEELIGKEVLLPDSMLPELTGNQFYYHEIIGFTVHDAEHGKLGEIQNVLESGGSAVFQITDGDHEILVPVADPFIQKLDRTNKTLHVTTPDGLVELYKK